MVAYTQSISNRVGIVAGKPAQFWGSTMTWGTSNWGTKDDFLQIVVSKILTNALALNDPSLRFDVAKDIQNSLTLTDAQQLQVSRIISESLSIEGDCTNQSLRDGNGYLYVFTRPTTNNETTVNTAYSSQSASVTSFTSQSNTSTAWS